MPRGRAMVLVLFVYLLAFIEVNAAQEYRVRLRIRPQAADTTVGELETTMCALLIPDVFGDVATCISKLTATTDTTYTNTITP